MTNIESHKSVLCGDGSNYTARLNGRAMETKKYKTTIDQPGLEFLFLTSMFRADIRLIGLKCIIK